MITILEMVSNWSSRFWPFMVNHLWQATLFALLVLVASHLVKRLPAKARHAVWLLALVKFGLPSAIILLVAKFAGIDFHSILSHYGSAVPVSKAISPTITLIAEPVLQQSASAHAISIGPYAGLYLVLSIIWVTACCTFLALWFRRRVQLSRAILAGQMTFSGREVEALKRVKIWLMIDRDVDLILSPRINEPGVWRVWNPVLVLPTGIADHLTEAELDTVIMHELFHVIRRDNLFGNLQMILCCLFWFHPIVWLIDRKLLAERERACDEAVIDHTGTSQIYASGILKVCRMGLTPGWKVAGVSGVSGSNLDKRIEHIMKNTNSGALKTAHWMLIWGLAVVAICFSLGAGVFSRSSVTAQSLTNGSGVEVPIHFRNERGYNERIPFLFTSAKAEVTKLQPATKSNDTVYRIRLKIALENNWSRQLTGLGVYLTNEESTWRVYMEQVNLSIEPSGQFEFEREVTVTLQNETSLGDLYIVAASGQSEAGDTWGMPVPSMRTMVKPPPPPPMPPLPPGAERSPQSIPPPPPPPPRPTSAINEIIPGGPVDGISGGIPGGIPGGEPIGVPGGIPGGEPGGVPGGIPNGDPGGTAPTTSSHHMLKEFPRPEYTEEARNNRTQGTVLVRIYVDSYGKIENAVIIDGLPDGLNEKALECAYKIRFNEGERFSTNVRISFALND
jgi:TonB family protein